MGHLRNYVGGDVVARFQRMCGYDVLHPMGWDAFGLPAENEARKQGRHPAATTRRYAANYRRQLDLVSVGYDWSREIFSTDPDYYRWTQWIFLRLYERGLAWRGLAQQWWCDDCATVLANEQVEWAEEEPRCWRGHERVRRREMAQWFLRISAYAQQLLDDLEGLDWPAGILAMQRHWIGRSEGMAIDFGLEALAGQQDGAHITVFTTRPETLPGAIALVLAPEHPLVDAVTIASEREAVAEYRAQAARRSEIARRSTEGAKTGVKTGAFAIHPLTGARLPIWVGDDVLPDHGHGAEMRVAEADAEHRASERDRVTAELQRLGRGRPEIQWRMRDWSVGRQRFWGAPIPILHCPACGLVPVPDEDLPLRLPEVERVPEPGVDAEGRPVSPLAAIPEFVNAHCPRCGGPARRETDTLDGFACSSWYFLRFASPHESDRPFDPEAVARWLPVDLYVGGAEHAVMHLLYARFWTKVLRDIGMLPFGEPFPRLRNQGMILDATGQKMSKSRPDWLITPDAAVAAHGADAIRCMLMFVAPFDQDVAWDEAGVAGVSRWLRRVWRLAQPETRPAARPAVGLEVQAPLSETAASGARVAEDRNLTDPGATADPSPTGPGMQALRATHRSIRAVEAAIAELRFNVAIARLMELGKVLGAAGNPPSRGGRDASAWSAAIDAYLRMLAPFAPHLAEELWSRRGGEGSVHRADWPAWDPALAAEESVEIVLQIDGRICDRFEAPAGLEESALRAMALDRPALVERLAGATPRRVIVVPGRLVKVLR